MTDIVRPVSPSTGGSSGSVYSPSDLNPELALIAMQREAMSKWPVPTIISKAYSVRYAIWQSLNHSETNKSYFDCSQRIAVYRYGGFESVNEEGKLFNALFTMWNKPKVIMQGISPSQFEQGEEQPGFITRVLNRVRGKAPDGKGSQ